jgi:hypothetical protein
MLSMTNYWANKALQPTQKPLRAFRSAELSRYVYQDHYLSEKTRRLEWCKT